MRDNYWRIRRNGKLEITQSQLESFIREQYSDPAKSTPLGSPGYVPRPAPPSFLFNADLPKLSEVAEVVRKARAASAPGPNGISYKLYKYCPGVQRYLWNLLRVAWKNQVIPSEWRRAVTVFIPKETNSTTISRSGEQKEREVTCMWCGWILPMHTGPSPTNSSSTPWTSSTSLSASVPW